jgi:hypothetical protein
MERRSRRRGLALVSILAALGLVLAAAPSFAGPEASSAKRQRGLREFAQGQSAAASEREKDDPNELLEAREWYAAPRIAPGLDVPAEALSSAEAEAARLGTVGGRWRELTDLPYDNDDPGYRDPVWSNSGAGWALVTGRMTAMASDGRWLYGGAADGGVWVSSDAGQHWKPTLQTRETASIGALYVNPRDHSLWVGTGEANTSSDSYAGQGIWRSVNHGRSYAKVGGDELRNALVFRITASGRYVYAATSRGLWRRSTHAARTSPWQSVLKPDPNPGNSPYNTSFITDVALKPGSGGDQVIAVLGWRLGTDYNGFYVSSSAGAPGSFAKVSPAGIDTADIGRTALSFSKDGKVLYAAIQSVTAHSQGPVAPNQSSILKGIYKSANSDVAGPWTLVADAAKLAASGSALSFPSSYEPGVQAWYNIYVEVDPADAKHVYLGLEEVFETSDGGATWKAIGPYWNFTLPCFAAGGPDNCPMTTHPDQHGITITDRGITYFGNDGGVYSRRTNLRGEVSWNNHNRRLFTLQYYYAGTGRNPRGGVDIWGGLQDNGVSLLRARRGEQVSPFGGDGGDVLIDPNNSDNAVVEYVNLAVAISRNGGRSDGSTESWRLVSPACAWNPDLAGCDPSPRFIAPFEPDVKDGNRWVTGGRYVWESTKGFDTVCEGNTCDWHQLTDLGADASLTAVAANGGTVYAGSCGPCNPLDEEGGGFASSIHTNYGGTWHKVTAPNLPNRFVNALTVDPADAAHVYAVYNGYSRRWIPSAGVGHVFESKDGGATWTDISGNLPDIPGDDLVLVKGRLVLATDNAVYVARADRPTRWSRLGRGLPNASVNDLALYPGKDYVIAATHGRGLWRLRLP